MTRFNTESNPWCLTKGGTCLLPSLQCCACSFVVFFFVYLFVCWLVPLTVLCRWRFGFEGDWKSFHPPGDWEPRRGGLCWSRARLHPRTSHPDGEHCSVKTRTAWSRFKCLTSNIRQVTRTASVHSRCQVALWGEKIRLPFHLFILTQARSLVLEWWLKPQL